MTLTPLPTVGFIGLGSMGSGMTRNLLSAGFPLVVNDVRKEAATEAYLRQVRAGQKARQRSRQRVISSLPCFPRLDMLPRLLGAVRDPRRYPGRRHLGRYVHVSARHY